MSHIVPVRAVTALPAAFYYKSHSGMNDQIQNTQHTQIQNEKHKKIKIPSGMAGQIHNMELKTLTNLRQNM